MGIRVGEGVGTRVGERVGVRVGEGVGDGVGSLNAAPAKRPLNSMIQVKCSDDTYFQR